MIGRNWAGESRPQDSKIPLSTMSNAGGSLRRGRALGRATASVAVSGASPETTSVEGRPSREGFRRRVRTTTFDVFGEARETATGAVALPKARRSRNSHAIVLRSSWCRLAIFTALCLLASLAQAELPVIRLDTVF